MAAGDGEILHIFLHVSFPLTQPDSIYFLTPPIVASEAGERIQPVKVIKGSIQPQSVTLMDDRGTKQPKQTMLFRNFPNPFNQSTAISYDLSEEGWVTIQIFDVNGRLVATPWDGRQSAGSHKIHFNAHHLTSGVYLYRLRTGDYLAIGKMILLH